LNRHAGGPYGFGVDSRAQPCLSCTRCGYELVGLPETGRCPECAYEIAQTRRDQREWPPPAVLRRVRIGAVLAAAGILLPQLGMLVGALLNDPMFPLLAVMLGTLCWISGGFCISVLCRYDPGKGTAAQIPSSLPPSLSVQAVVAALLLMLGTAEILGGGGRNIVGLAVLGGFIFVAAGMFAWIGVFVELHSLVSGTLSAPLLAVACRGAAIASAGLVLGVVVLMVGAIVLGGVIILGVSAFAAAVLLMTATRLGRFLSPAAG
jgi:hypothetical protein